jgi:hypothetical protein
MKNILRNSGTLLLCLFLIITSCNEEVDVSKLSDPNSKTETVIKGENAVNARLAPAGMTWITFDASRGEYVSSYGTGITFGANFPHPITVDATGLTDGEPAGGFDFVGFRDVPTLYSTIQGNKFAMVQPAFPSGPSADQIYAYFNALRFYWAYGYWSGNYHPDPLGSATGGGGTIEIRGQVVRDHTSPTNVSITSDEYVYTPPPTNTPGQTGTFPLGTLVKNGYTIKFFGPLGYPQSGTVSKIEVKDANGAPVSAVPMGINYIMNYEGDQYHLTGKIKLPGAVFLQLDDYIYSVI